MKITVGSCLTLSGMPSHVRERVEAALTHKNPEWVAAMRFGGNPQYVRIPKFIQTFTRDGNDLIVPRGTEFTDEALGSFAKKFDASHVIDERTTAPVNFPPRLLSLNAEQSIALRAFKKKWREWPFGNYLLVLSTSIGKTILQAVLAATLRQRTLVLFHNSVIQKAWEDDLQKLYGLKKSDIGIVRQSKMVVGKHFTLGMLQTVTKRITEDPEFFKQFGTVILDEADISPAPTFEKVINRLPCKYRIGATATTRRKDHKEFWMKAMFGPVFFRLAPPKQDTEHSMLVNKVDVVRTLFKFEPPDDLPCFDYSGYLEAAILDPDRNKTILDKIVEDDQHGRRCLIVAQRRMHCQLFLEHLRNLGLKAEMLWGSMNRKQIDEVIARVFSGETKHIVSTAQFITRGANLNPLDSLHLITPQPNKTIIEQLIGRIRRKWKRKPPPKVVYYLDREISYCKGIYKNHAVPVFRKLNIGAFKDLFIA